MIRLILVVLFLIVYFLIGIPLFLIMYLVGLVNINARHHMALAIVQTAFRFILFLSGVHVIVQGQEHIPRDQAVLYVGDHTGFFDILAGYTTVPGLTGFVSKIEIKKVPFLNWWMYFVNCLFFDRKDMRAAVRMILEGVEKLKSGISVFIFPEGTRSKDGKLGDFKEGSFKMATKANVPIIPVAIKGSSAIFEDQFPRIRKGTIQITYGTPLCPWDYSKEEQKHIGRLAKEEIAGMLGQMP